MGLRGRTIAQAMEAALVDMAANGDQTIRQVADRHQVSFKNFRVHVRSRGLVYKRERNRRGIDYANQPAYQPMTEAEKAMIAYHRQRALDERLSAPAETRLRRLLTDDFERLARLWGDWIKK